MGFRVGSGYFGSSSAQQSSVEQEIIQQHKPVGFDGEFKAYKFSFVNTDPVSIKINGSDSIYLKANQGFSSEYYDAGIYSFVVVDDGIEYNYIGAY